MTAHGLSQLGLVESRPGLQFVVPLVAPQSIHLQLKQVHLRHLDVMVRRLSPIVACFPLSFVANTLDEVFMEVADIEMADTLVDVQLQFLLGYAFLNPLAEGGVSSWSAATFTVLYQTTDLAIERRSWWTVVAVFFCAEPIHNGRIKVFAISLDKLMCRLIKTTNGGRWPANSQVTQTLILWMVENVPRRQKISRAPSTLHLHSSSQVLSVKSRTTHWEKDRLAASWLLRPRLTLPPFENCCTGSER